MPITFSNLGASQGSTPVSPDFMDNVDRTSYEGPSWTPPASGLIFVYVFNHAGSVAANVAPTLTGNSLTWTQIRSEVHLDVSTNLNRISLFAANASGSSTGTLTVDFSGNTQLNCIVVIAQADGVDLSGGVAAAFVQTQHDKSVTTGDTATVTLNAAAHADNRPIVGVSHTTNISITHRTGWTELDDLRIITPTDTLETQAKTDGFETTASGSWGQAEHWGILAAELKAEQPAPSGTVRIYKRFFGPAHLTGAATDLYTVPADRRATIRSIHVQNPSGGAVGFTFSIGADAAGTRIFDNYSISAGSVFDDTHDHILAAGEKIQGFASSAGVLTLTVGGYEESLG